MLRSGQVIKKTRPMAGHSKNLILTLSGKYGPKILIELFSSEGVGFDPPKNYVSLRSYITLDIKTDNCTFS